MELLIKKIVESKTVIAFLMFFSPLIISILIITNGQSLGISDKLSFTIAGMFYPYFQLLVWIYWMWYAVNRLVEHNQINTRPINKYNKLIRFSKVIFIFIISVLIINSIIPGFIEYPEIIKQIVLYISYGLIIVHIYLFYTWIYGFWIITKTLNDVYEKKGKDKSMSIFLFFFMPLTFA